MNIKKLFVSMIVVVLTFFCIDVNAAEAIPMIERLSDSNEFHEIKKLEDKIISWATIPDVPREVTAADIDYDHALKIYGDVEIFKQQRSTLKEKMTEDFTWMIPVHVDQVTVVIGVSKVPPYDEEIDQTIPAEEKEKFNWKELAGTYDILSSGINNDFSKYEEEVQKIVEEKDLPQTDTRVVFLSPDVDIRNQKAVVLVEDQIRYVIPLIDVTISVQNSNQRTTKNEENATQLLTAFQAYDYQKLNEVLLPENSNNEKDGGGSGNTSEKFSMIPYLTIGGGISMILLVSVVYIKKKRQKYLR